MTREENLHWLDAEIRTWESECQSKHPIKEALYAARKALKQEPILEKDGTLIVTTEHYENVGRVLVQYGTNGALFYQDREPTAKNDTVDAISREQALRELKESAEHHANDSREEVLLRRDRNIIRALPSVTPQEPILDEIRAEIGKSKTEHEMQIAEGDIKAKLLISHIYCDIVNILDKYKA